MHYYYALTDPNGMFCVDQVGDEWGPSVEGEVANLAMHYPEVIYFEVES